MNDCLHKRQNGTCEILSEKDGVQEYCVEGPCPYDTTLKGDYIKREEVFSEINFHESRGGNVSANIRNAVRRLPAADVVEVVRCKNCKYWGIERGYNESDPPKLNPQPDGTVYAECVHGPVEIGDCMYTDGDFYCAFGNRRTEK